MVIGQDGNTMTDSEQILMALKNGTAAFAPLGGIGEELGGYKGYLVWLDRKDKGVPLGEAVRKELMQLHDELGMDFNFS